MSKRPLTALAAALALLVATAPAARAQAPTPTPTPTVDQAEADAPAGASRAVKRIYEDYRDGGKIDVCSHARADLQKALDSIKPDVDTNFPDFREIVRAGIQRHDNGRCGDESPAAGRGGSSSGGGGSSSGGGESSSGGGATSTPAPATTAAPPTHATPESGALPPDTGSSHEGPVQPESGTLPAEPGATPAPTVAPEATPPVTVSPAVTATPVVVTRSGGGGLLVPGILLAVALLCGAALAAFAVGARRSPRMRHAWREASLRTRGTWSDFSDWLRLGR